nr:DNA-directed RNA polymerase subunit alpha C-terminal domain-containing protein [Fredinandcohnia onubensis]
MKKERFFCPEIDELKLSKPALRALHGAGYVMLEQFTKLTEREVLALHGVGPTAIRELRSALGEKGLAFKTEE